MQETKLVLTVPEIAEMLGINIPKAYDLARREDFPAFKLGKRIIIPKDAFLKWLEEQTKTA